MYNEDYLAHYGVKGMKWGVRRAIGDKAKIAANLERRSNAYKKHGDRFTKKADKYDNKLKDSRPTEKQLAKSKSIRDRAALDYKTANQLNKYRNEAIKNLSQKDIEQGRKYLTKAVIASNMLVGIYGSTAVRIHDDARADKFIKEQESKNK